MTIAFRCRQLSAIAALSVAALTGRSAIAAPTVEDALKLLPVQKDVDYDTPPAEDVAKCTIKPENQNSWVVRDKNGDILRRFIDTNSDKVVDQWSYYLDGTEVYRDVDGDYNGKPEQSRWLNTAGIRWGMDTNEDGKIDYWKAISAEEVSAELVAAIAEKDVTRFSRLLLAPEEMKTLGFSEARAKDVQTRTTAATDSFRKLLASQKTLAKGSRWLQFGGSRAGVVPAGTDGSMRDLTVYENAIVVVDNAGKHGQLQIATLIRVGDTWRIIDPPQIVGDDVAGLGQVAGTFLGSNRGERVDGTNVTGNAGGPPQNLLADLERIDKELDSATPEQQSRLTAQKAETIELIATAVDSPEDRAQWIRQLADMVSASVQSGVWPQGVEKLRSLRDKLSQDPASAELAAYVEFRFLTAEYGLAIATNNDFPTVQKNWLASLEKYVTDHPEERDTAEAMLQLAIAQEFAGQEEEAKKWYTQIHTKFPETQTAKKALGAITRLDCVGKTIRLKGASATGGKPIDLSQYAGKVVLVQYWATWCEPARVDLAQLNVLHQQSAKDGLVIISVSLDTDPDQLTKLLQTSRLPWPQIYEPGGLDSRLANEMGILTLPTMILIGKDGKVVNRNVHITEVEREINNLLK